MGEAREEEEGGGGREKEQQQQWMPRESTIPNSTVVADGPSSTTGNGNHVAQSESTKAALIRVPPNWNIRRHQPIFQIRNGSGGGKGRGSGRGRWNDCQYYYRLEGANENAEKVRREMEGILKLQ
jgi:hypothetical protein